MNNPVLISLVLDLSAVLFCLVVGLFIVPVILERLAYYLPRLYFLVIEKAVFKRSIFMICFEIIGWTFVLVSVYYFFHSFFPGVFVLVSTSWLALGAWGVALLNMLYRLMRFNKVVKSEFYHKVYMHYITPHALQAYQAFIEELEDINDTELKKKAELGKAIPYMHRQAVHRKMSDCGLLSPAAQTKKLVSKKGEGA